jgi:hypothetical protein
MHVTDATLPLLSRRQHRDLHALQILHGGGGGGQPKRDGE